MKRTCFIIFAWLLVNQLSAQTPQELINKIKAKLEKVNDYTAKGKLKTNVVFIKAPIASVKVYYKKPDKMKIVNENGISFIPKGSVNINLTKFISGSDSYEIVDAGIEASTGLRMLKLLPSDENSEIVLSTLYIDEKAELIKKAKNTTRDNGTYELELNYGKYAPYCLPDKVIFSFQLKIFFLSKYQKAIPKKAVVYPISIAALFNIPERFSIDPFSVTPSTAFT